MAGQVTWFEVICNDLERSGKFYNAVFGWKTQAWQEGYSTFETGSSPNGGLMKRRPEMPCDVFIYVDVDSIEETLKKAEANGGKTILQKMEVPEVGFIAFFADPDGNPIGIWTKK